MRPHWRTRTYHLDICEPCCGLATANSVKGTLTHNSRANESLSFTILHGDKPVEQADVRVIARMPHHDYRIPGGHDPANDPDVEGLGASPFNIVTFCAVKLAINAFFSRWYGVHPG